jgi:small subunit ribosomal protein S7
MEGIFMVEEIAKEIVKDVLAQETIPVKEVASTKEAPAEKALHENAQKTHEVHKEHTGHKAPSEHTNPTKTHETKTEDKPYFVKKKSQFASYKLFNKWSFDEVVVSDPSLMKYINLEPVIVPHTFGRKNTGSFSKQNINVVERLINKLMRSGQGKRKLSGKYIRGRGGCGKKMQTIEILKKAFEIIETKTKKNPIQVLVEALENSAPHEDVTRVKKGGVAYSIAVDVSPMKGLDESLKNIALAGFGNSFNKNTSAEEALAEEIIAAAAKDGKSIALKRKDEVERIAKASR